MSEFEAYFASELGLINQPTNLNRTTNKALRQLVASYSYHLQICSWLNIPVRQWTLVIGGCLLGLVLIMLVLLMVLLDRVITVKCLERLFKKRLVYERFNQNVARHRSKVTTPPSAQKPQSPKTKSNFAKTPIKSSKISSTSSSSGTSSSSSQS